MNLDRIKMINLLPHVLWTKRNTIKLRTWENSFNIHFATIHSIAYYSMTITLNCNLSRSDLRKKKKTKHYMNVTTSQTERMDSLQPSSHQQI